MENAPRFTALSEAAESLLGQLADEFIEANNRHEPQCIEDLAKRHPDLADVIRRMFPAMLALRSPHVATDAVHDSQHGAELGDFLLLGELGRGGMGVVFEAFQRSLGRRVALKVLPLAAILDERHLRRFQNEAHAAAVLQHPHIVSVFGVGCERGVHYYAMQLIDGLSLAEVLRRMARSPELNVPVDSEASTAAYAAFSTQGSRGGSRNRAVANLGIQAAEALAYAHREGVVHRDIKPSNLILDRQGKLWITDFGLARIQSSGELTHTGDVLGTLRYMSPEQLTDNKVVDQRTDVYSLGLTLYEALSGCAAFEGVPREQLPQKILGDEPTPLRKLDPSIPVDLETIVLRATAKDRDARYQTADELAADLRRFVEYRPILARRLTRGQRLRYWARRNPALAATVSALLIAMSVLSVGGPVAALRQRSLAEAANRNLYISDLNLAYDAWYRGHVDRVEELLAKHSERHTQGDSRDFAYLYLRRQIETAGQTILYRQRERLHDVSISPDGGLVACCGAFPGILIIDAKTGRLLRTLREHDDHVSSLAFSPDGELLIAGGKQVNAAIWNTTNWRCHDVTLVHATGVSSVRVAPDGQTFVVGTVGGQLSLCNRDGNCLWTIDAHRSVVYPPAYSANGAFIATASEDHNVRLWDTATGALKRSMPRLGGPAFGVEWSDDNRKLIVAGSEGIKYFDAETGTELRGLVYDLKPVASLAQRDGLLVTGGHDHLLQFWDLASGLRLGVTVADRAQVTGMSFTPNGKQLITVGGDGTLRRFELAKVLDDQERLRHVDWEWIASVAVTANGKQCISVAAPLAKDQSVDESRGELVVWDLTTGNRRHTASVSPRFGADVSISADGRVCATAGFGGVRLWDFESLAPIQDLVNDDRNQYWTVAVSPNGRWLAAAGRNNTPWMSSLLLTIWDLKTAPPQRIALRSSDPQGEAVSLAFSEDSQLLSVARSKPDEGVVDLWSCDGREWRESHPRIGVHTELCTDTAFVPGTHFVASSGYDGVVGLLDHVDSTKSRMYRMHLQAVFSVAASPDGLLLASGGDREIRLWDRTTGDQLATMQVPMWVSSIAFTPDGSTLIWGGGDGSVHFERSGIQQHQPPK